jgi:competence protein ComEA
VRRRLADACSALGVSSAEALALALLAAGGCALLAALWWSARPAPLGPPMGPPVGPGPAGPEGRPESLAGPGGAPVLDEAEVVVHVTGAVAAPGLYRLQGGARIADAVEAAGGPLPDAVLDGLNLARPLQDGEQVRVPDVAGVAVEGSGAGPGGSSPPGPWRADGTLDLNRASATDLQTLPRVGPVLAQRILDHRERIGGFREVGQLREVPGIGEVTFQGLVELVSV